MEQLNLLLREVIARVVVMQAYTKGWLGARRYRKDREKRSRGALVIQSGTQANSKRLSPDLKKKKKASQHQNFVASFDHSLVKQV